MSKLDCHIVKTMQTKTFVCMFQTEISMKGETYIYDVVETNAGSV